MPGMSTLLTITGDVWNATGLLSCTDDGFVRVTIGPPGRRPSPTARLIIREAAAHDQRGWMNVL